MDESTALPINITSNAPEGLVGAFCSSNETNSASLERINFHQELILEAIDTIRAKKLRPNKVRIALHLYSEHKIHKSVSEFCINRLVELGALINVPVRGGESYWDPSKSPKALAPMRKMSNKSSISKKLITDARLLLSKGDGEREGFTLKEIEKALKFMEDECTKSRDKTELPPELIGLRPQISLERVASCGSLTKLLDGRYTLDENRNQQSNAHSDRGILSIKPIVIRRPSQQPRTRGCGGSPSCIKSRDMVTSLNYRPILPAPPGYKRNSWMNEPLTLAINPMKDQTKSLTSTPISKMASTITMPISLPVQLPLQVGTVLDPKGSLACGTTAASYRTFGCSKYVDESKVSPTTSQQTLDFSTSEPQLYPIDLSMTKSTTFNSLFPSPISNLQPHLQRENTAKTAVNSTGKIFNRSEINGTPEAIPTSARMNMAVNLHSDDHLGGSDAETGETISANSYRPQYSNKTHTTTICTRPANVRLWTAVQVAEWLREQGNYEQEAHIFLENDIDGNALMLLSDPSVLTQAKIKVGPALKIFKSIQNLQFTMASRDLWRMDFHNSA
ncbi:hypothetical protein Aperf_G00000007294 [Anoplocephala perfoliata]